MAAERVLELSPLGLIRAFELLSPSGSVHQVLVWVEDSVIVMKDGAELSNPHRGLTKIALAEVSGVALMTDPAGVVLVIQTEQRQFRLLGTPAVIDGFVEELRHLGTSMERPRDERPPRRLHRWLDRVLGV